MNSNDQAMEIRQKEGEREIILARERIPLGLSDAALRVEVVTEVIGRILAVEPVSTAQAQVGWDPRSRKVLAVLTCCYAAGVYASQEIEVLIHSMPLDGMDWDGPIPDWNALRCFRRRYRPLIHRCLAEVLEVCHTAEQPRIETDSGRYVWHPRAEQSADPWDDRPTSWVEEAENRIQRAVVLDSAALDD